MIYDVLTTEKGQLSWVQVPGSALTQDVQFSPSPVIFKNGSGGQFFVDGDNVTIEKIRWIFPYSFNVGESDNVNVTLGFVWTNGLGIKVIPEFGTSGNVHMSPFCKELTPNIRLAAPDPGVGGNFQLRLNYVEFPVSNIGLPAILENETIEFAVQMEVKHTIAMVP